MFELQSFIDVFCLSYFDQINIFRIFIVHLMMISMSICDNWCSMWVGVGEWSSMRVGVGEWSSVDGWIVKRWCDDFLSNWICMMISQRLSNDGLGNMMTNNWDVLNNALHNWSWNDLLLDAMSVDWLYNLFAVILSLALVWMSCWDRLDDWSNVGDGRCLNDRHMWLDDCFDVCNMNWGNASHGNREDAGQNQSLIHFEF